MCVEFCVLIDFTSVERTRGFLDTLELYVLNDRLNYITQEVMAHYIEHCHWIDDVSALERCLLHMDATIMDFGSIVTLLKENEIYTALIYVYASELNDVFNPLEISICQ